MEEHLSLQTEENLRSGMTPAEARRQARLKFGAVEAIREQYHAEKSPSSKASSRTFVIPCESLRHSHLVTFGDQRNSMCAFPSLLDWLLAAADH